MRVLYDFFKGRTFLIRNTGKLGKGFSAQYKEIQLVIHLNQYQLKAVKQITHQLNYIKLFS